MTTRAEVIAEARSWLGVPWVHQGRSRAGVDCLGLLLGVARALHLSDFEFRNYNLFNNPSMLFDLCDEHMDRVDLQRAQPGDVAAISYPHVPHHLAFLGDYRHGDLSLIHALNLGKCQVVEHGLAHWRARIARVYCMREVG
jgi:cell wall-associated NlpC family hydrolase